MSGTVVDAKALGHFAGGALLQIRLDSINIKGAEVPVQTTAKSFTEKGKGKRTAVMAGGGAAHFFELLAEGKRLLTRAVE